MRYVLRLAAFGISAASLLLTMGGTLAQAPPVGDPPPPAGAQQPPPGGVGPPGSELTLDDIVVQTGAQSAGRGAPLPALRDTIVGAKGEGGPPIADQRAVFSARNGDVPAGIEPLQRDVFSSDDFYIDRDLWLDPRYWRCNSPFGISSAWGSSETPTVGETFPLSVWWGYCDRDYPREEMVSPYSFATAEEHYNALMAEAASRGGPTQYSRENLPPDWDGAYSTRGFGQFTVNGNWLSGQLTQVPTYLSLLTPEYQARYVQQMWHEAHNQAVWPGAYCWPEGFTRRFASGTQWVQVGTQLVQVWARESETMATHVHIGSQFRTDGSVPNLLGDLRQWYGDTVGFWDGDILVTWTSNVRAWIAHGSFEFSDQMQSIEIYSPITDKDGKFVGLSREAILYDPEAFVQPIRIVHLWERVGDLNQRPFDWRQCAQTLFPVEGAQTPVNPGETIDFTVPDMTGRPWADIWVKYFERKMQRSEQKDVLESFQ